MGWTALHSVEVLLVWFYLSCILLTQGLVIDISDVLKTGLFFGERSVVSDSCPCDGLIVARQGWRPFWFLTYYELFNRLGTEARQCPIHCMGQIDTIFVIIFVGGRSCIFIRGIMLRDDHSWRPVLYRGMFVLCKSVKSPLRLFKKNCRTHW